jgi:aminoglycoside phosphotransferase (APT) family kinase protein
MIEITEALVRSLLRDQHPDLAELPLAQVSGGWDNQLWRLGEELAVRLPRTSRAPELLHRELQWLPELLVDLPLAVSTPVRAGEPSVQFPHPWIVARWVPGEPGDFTPIRDAAGSADRLAEFLRALHRPAPAEAPHTDRGAPLHTFTDPPPDRLTAATTSIWKSAVTAAPWDGERIWLHGDLHPANIITNDGTLTGIVDFGELCAGDPASDIAAAWTLLPAEGIPRFLAAYGRADADTVRRARGWALLRGLGLIDIGQAGVERLPGGKPSWLPAGLATIERCLVY